MTRKIAFVGRSPGLRKNNPFKAKRCKYCNRKLKPYLHYLLCEKCSMPLWGKRNDNLRREEGHAYLL